MELLSLKIWGKTVWRSRKAWSQKQVLYNAKRIFFDNDYFKHFCRSESPKYKEVHLNWIFLLQNVSNILLYFQDNNSFFFFLNWHMLADVLLSGNHSWRRPCFNTWCTFDNPGSQRHNSLPFLHRGLAYETRTWLNGCLEDLFVYIVPVFVSFYFNYLPLTAKVFLLFYITGTYTGA